MKRLLAILFSMFIATVVLAQSPLKLSYQAVIRNSTNQLVTSHAVGMKISILQGTATGTVAYTETQTPTTNANGLVSIEFGGGTGFDAINWANGPYFVKTETDPTGGTTYTITGTSQLLTVPYSLFAKTSGNGLTTADATKLAGIAAGAEVNVNADWNATSGDAQIFNKPTLAAIATSGSYNDLSNKPTTDGSETKVTAGTNVTVTGLGTTSSPYIVNSTASGSGPSGTAIGDMLYWSGTAWQLLPKGSNGQVLKINDSGLPAWQNATAANLLAPAVTTLAATNITSNSVTFNSIVNGNGFETHVEFYWGTTTDYFCEDEVDNEIYGASDVPVRFNFPYDRGWMVSDSILRPGTTYHYRVVASNAVNITYGNDMTFTTLPLPTDIDGNVYNEVVIGNQIWMSENLKTIKYRNGDLIPNVTDNAQWAGLTTGAWCKYNNGAGVDVAVGNLYNFYAVVDSRNLCPTGWHVPTYDEWSTLSTYLGGDTIAGGKLKEGSEGDDEQYYTGYWHFPNKGATNESGFDGLPGGYRGGVAGSFSGLGYVGDFWTSTEKDATSAYFRELYYNDKKLTDYYNTNKRLGCSVRCIKDTGVTKQPSQSNVQNKAVEKVTR